MTVQSVIDDSATLNKAIAAIRKEIAEADKVPLRWAHDEEWTLAHAYGQGLRFALDRLTEGGI